MIHTSDPTKKIMNQSKQTKNEPEINNNQSANDLSQLIADLYTLTSNPNIRVQKRIKDSEEFIEKHKKTLTNDFNVLLQQVDCHLTLMNPIVYDPIIKGLDHNPCKEEELNTLSLGYGKVIFRYLLLTKFAHELIGNQREELIDAILHDLIHSMGCLIKRFSRGQLIADYLHYYELLLEQCNLILELGLETQENLLLKLKNVTKNSILVEKEVACGRIILLKLSKILLGYQQAVMYLSLFGEDYTKFLTQASSINDKLYEMSRNIGKLKAPTAVVTNIGQYNIIFSKLTQQKEAYLKINKSFCLNLFNIINDFYIHSFGKNNATLQESCVEVLLVKLESLLLTINNIPENIKTQIFSLIKQCNITPINEHRYEVAGKILQLLTLVVSNFNVPSTKVEECVAHTTQAILKQIKEEIDKNPQPIEELTESLVTEVSLLNLEEGKKIDQKEDLNIVIEKIKALKLEESQIDQNYKQETQALEDAFETELKNLEQERKNLENKLKEQRSQNQTKLESMRNTHVDSCNDLKSQIQNLMKQYKTQEIQEKLKLDKQTKAYQQEQTELMNNLNTQKKILGSLKSDYAKKRDVFKENHLKALEKIKSQHQQDYNNQYNQETKRWESKLDKQNKAYELEQIQLTNNLNNELNNLISSLKSDYATKNRIFHDNHLKALEKIKIQHRQNYQKEYDQETKRWKLVVDKQKKAYELEQTKLINRLNNELNDLISSLKSDYAKNFEALEDEHLKTLEEIENQHQQKCNEAERKAIFEHSLVAIFDFPRKVQWLQGILERAGIEHYIFGGAVRDYLEYFLKLHLGYTQLNINPDALINDIDVLVNCTPEELPLEIKNYTTVTGWPNLLKLNGEINIDLLCERWDNLYTKLMKCDFTVNALICRGREVYDPLGFYNDLFNPNLMVIGNAKERFEQDPVVILRMIRLAIKLGREIQFEDRIEIQNSRHLVSSLSIRTYLNNLRKLFANHFAWQYYEGVLNLGLLHVVIPTLTWNYQAFLSGPLAILDRFWQQKIDEIAMSPENFTGNYILTLFLLMQFLICGNINEVINAFLNDFSNISNIDRKRCSRSINALMLGNNNSWGIYHQYQHFESTVKREEKLAQVREYTSNIVYPRSYTPSYPSYGPQPRSHNNETSIDRQKVRLI